MPVKLRQVLLVFLRIVQLITQELANYQNYKALYDTEGTDEAYDIAALSLYKVAQSYEALENYPEAIATYEENGRGISKT